MNVHELNIVSNTCDLRFYSKIHFLIRILLNMYISLSHGREIQKLDFKSKEIAIIDSKVKTEKFEKLF